MGASSCCTVPTGVVYSQHDKEIRKALDEAAEAGLKHTANTGRSSHTWGYLNCTCGERFAIYSTGRNPENGAKLIRQWTRKHKEHR